MSLRSASPCTSTSRPKSSWSLITEAISSRRNSSSCCCVILPARASARWRRISPVCGNEPMVVVGSFGRFRSAWASRRVFSSGRSKSCGFTDAARSRIAALCLRGSAVKRASASSAVFNSASTADSPSARPRARVTISATFWSAKARPSTGTSAGSSRSRSCGTCCSEVEDATATAPPLMFWSACRSVRRSARQILRPLMAPATRVTPESLKAVSASAS